MLSNYDATHFGILSMNKTALVYGASGMLGSHLSIDLARKGYKVKAISKFRNVVTDEISHYASLSIHATEKDMVESDIVIDCGARPSCYPSANALTGAPHYQQAQMSNTVALSPSLMFCEHTTISANVPHEYVMDSYRKDHYTSSMANHILRLPKISIEGHALPKDILIQSDRGGIEYEMLRASENDVLRFSENKDSVIEVLPISNLSTFVLKALSYKFSHVSSNRGFTYDEYVDYLLERGIVNKSASFKSKILFNENIKKSNHFKQAEWCPNLYEA